MATGPDVSDAASTLPTRHALTDAGPSPVARVGGMGSEVWWQVVTVATLTAIGVCTARALLHGYIPLEDNAVTAMRAADVFSPHPPLVGLVSSASHHGGPVSHPGPLQLDLLAPVVTVLPRGVGVAVGTAAINAAAVGATVWSARRFLGPSAAAVVGAVLAVLVWSLGSEAVFEPWQPIAAMLPFLCGVVAAWGVAAGRDALAPIAVVALTFAMQTHGSYLLLVPTVVVAAGVLRWSQARRGVPFGRRPLVFAGVAATVVWTQPIIDQFAGTGNLSRLWRHAVGGSSSGEVSTLEHGDALRVVASVIVEPPMWIRSDVGPTADSRLQAWEAGAVDDSTWLSLPWSLVGLAALVILLGVVVAMAVRRGDSTSAAGGALALTLVIAAIVSVAGLPVDAFGISPHRVRWLWVIGAFLTAYLLVAALRLGAVVRDRDAVSAVGLVGLVAAVATLPTSNQLLSPQQFMVDRYDAAGRLEDVAEQLAGLGVVYLNTLGRPFPDPYNDAFAAAMADAGIAVRVAGEYSALQYGTHRRLGDGDGAADVTAHIFVGSYPDGLPAPYGEVARFADGLEEVVVGAAFGTVRERPG